MKVYAREALKITDNIYQAIGFGNTYLIVKLAGGPDSVTRLANERLASGKVADALRLTEAALAADSLNRAALETRMKVLENLRDHCKNTNERGWLDYSINETRAKLSRVTLFPPPTAPVVS